MFDTQTKNCNHPHNKTKDHIYPISKGGRKGESNMVYSCRTCNNFKGNLTPKEFYLRLVELSESKNGFRHYSKETILVALRNTKVLLAIIEEHPERYIYDEPKPVYVPFHNRPIEERIKLKDYPKVLALEDEKKLKILLSHPEPNFHY